MNKTIVIACDEQGQYSVGEKPAASEEMGMGDAQPEMQPAESLDSALEMARELFGDDPTGEVSAEGDEQMAKGFKSAGGDEYMRGGM